jgi:hypothetical protein
LLQDQRRDEVLLYGSNLLWTICGLKYPLSRASEFYFKRLRARTKLTVSLAVARISPSGLSSRALRAALWAGIMLTFPRPVSTSCTCPGVRPGKASSREPKQQSPKGLSAVSKTESFSGGDEKAYTWILLLRVTTMRVRDKRTR